MTGTSPLWVNMTVKGLGDRDACSKSLKDIQVAMTVPKSLLFLLVLSHGLARTWFLKAGLQHPCKLKGTDMCCQVLTTVVAANTPTMLTGLPYPRDNVPTDTGCGGCSLVGDSRHKKFVHDTCIAAVVTGLWYMQDIDLLVKHLGSCFLVGCICASC